MVSSTKSAGNGATPVSAAHPAQIGPHAGAASASPSAPATNGHGRVVDSPSARAALAAHCAIDIAMVVQLLKPTDTLDELLTVPVRQMIQQRLHDLAHGINTLLSDPGVPLAAIHGDLYPSQSIAALLDKLALDGGGA